MQMKTKVGLGILGSVAVPAIAGALFDIPMDLESLGTIAGMAAVATLLTTWLKSMLPDWRFTSLMVLGLCLLLSLGAVFGIAIDSGAGFTAEQIIDAILVALGGASLATFGYETVKNVLGVSGVGARSDKELDLAAGFRIATRDGVIPIEVAENV